MLEMEDKFAEVSIEVPKEENDVDGAKASLSTTPREAPSSPQLSRIPRFNRRLSSTPCLEQDVPPRANSQTSLSSVSPASERSTSQGRLSPSNGRSMKKRLSANDLYVEPRRSSIPALSLTEKTSERVERVISRSSSRRPSYSDSGNGSSLLSSAHFSTGFSTVDSGRSSSRRGSSLAIDQDAAKREGVISYTPQIRTAPVSDPGRVQVYVRIRPRNDDEEGRGDPVGVSIEDQQMTQLKVLDGKNDRLYQFDGILPEIATNREVFKEVAQPLLRSALSGFNGILMCYGQTGTGKTYTLMSNDGMTVRVICKCFSVIKRDVRHRYTVTCSYLQIYQDKIYDLLNATRTVDLSLREHPKRGVYVENLTEYVVHSPKEVLNLLKVGRRRLVFAETQMNRASSRSHAICELRILKERAKDNPAGSRSQTPSFNELQISETDLNASWSADMLTEDDDGDEEMFNDSMNFSRTSIDLMQNEDDEEIMDGLTDLDDSVTSVRGKIYICDLAGSERIKRTKASGERLQEAQHINSSLLELGNVIQALAEGNRSHVPFRNSTLTRLLQEGLAGNCKTRLVVCIAPTARDVHETKCSLNFGSRAMKVQVTAHVNYEVDYKKLAECLVAKLESLESEWNLQKGEYEKIIQTLKLEISTRRDGSKILDGPAKDFRSNVDKHQVQSLLVLELMTLQLFYGLQGQSHLIGSEETAHARLTVMSNGSKEALMRSMEGLLELLNEYERGPVIKAASRTSSTGSSAITSPDYIEHNITDGSDLPSTLEPVARFLEHAQQIELNYKNNVVVEKVSRERTKRVLEQLAHLKENISSSALESLKKTFEFNKELQDTNVSALMSVENLVSKLQADNELSLRKDAADDVGVLENSLYYLLMDKALLNCILMVGSQAENFVEVWSEISSARIQESDEDRKLMLEELKTEKRIKEQMENELFDVKEERNSYEEKVKDLELELKTVRELKGSLETKLFALESKNSRLEEQVEKVRKEKSELEAKIDELEKRKELLENSLRSTENNNAKKERMLVDLRNEKVALDSIVSTLKDELTILEKEKVRDRNERKRIEEELDDVKDRNIILETEWSCCKEENGLLETELTALEEDKAELEDELAKYREDVKMLEEALDILQKEADDYKTEISNLKCKEEKLANIIRQEKERFNKELSAMKQEISSLRVEKRRFQRDISMSKADRSNTERAYNSLKNQKDALQGDIASMRQEEKRLHRELAALRNDKAKLEREVSSLKLENSRLKTELASAEKLKMDIRILQKNEEKMASSFKQGREKLAEEMTQLKDKYGKLESEFSQLQIEKDKIWIRLKQYEESSDGNGTDGRKSARRVSHPHAQCSISDKKVKTLVSNRPSSFGSVTEVEGKVLDLQRRLAFFMAEKEDMQKEIIVSRENNKKLNQELRTLEQDTSHIQGLLASLSEEKNSLLKRIEENNEVRKLLESEREQLRKAVETSKEINNKLQIRIDEISERNRIIECDRISLEQCMKKLQGEACVLAVENKHVRHELGRVEGDLEETKKKLASLNEDYKTINKRLTESESNEKEAKEHVLKLQTENMNVKEQLADCHAEEKELLKQLSSLTEKFRNLERKVEEVLIERSVLLQHSAEKQQIAKQTRELREANSILEQTFHDLRLQIEKLTADVEDFKEEKQEVERMIKEFEENGGEGQEENQKEANVESLKALRVWIVGLKEDRESLMEKTTDLANQLKDLSKEKEEFSHIAADKAARLEQEKLSYQEKLRDLYKQLETIIKEKKMLQAEVDFVKTQNSEVRAEIAIVLEENEKLENELEELEDDFEKQQNELDAAKEETKNLLRQLCGIETKNLELCTDNSNYEDDLENLREKCDRLIKENRKLSEKIEKDESEKITMHDRMLMAELEVSRMRVECEELMEQRKRIEGELINSERDKHLLRTELTGLARALSPLKKEVRAAVEKQIELQMAPRITSDRNDENDALIEGELIQAQQELASFNAEKGVLEEEEKLLKRKIDIAMTSKNEVRQKLHDIILELSTDSGNVSSELYLSEQSSDVDTPRGYLPGGSELDEKREDKCKDDDNKEEIKLGEIRRLIEQSDILKEEENLLKDEISDAERIGSRKEGELSTVCTEMQSVQEKLSLAIVNRMQLSQKVHEVGKSTKTAENCEGAVRIKDMQKGINDLKGCINKFEKSSRTILTELKQFSSHLDHTENNFLAIGSYKSIIEKHLKQYKERNSLIEDQLHQLREDLIEIEKRLPDSSVKGTDMLLETVRLHKHQSNLVEDLASCEHQNEELKSEASELCERFKELEQEKKLTNTTQETLEGSLESQQRKILQLQKEKETLAYEKNKLQTKLSLFKDDKRRLLDDFARLNKSLTAYAQYNGELELKLESFKVDLSSLEAKASLVKNGKAKRLTNGVNQVKSLNPGLLCETCRLKVQRKFSGVSKNTQLLGEELLDCIDDNISLETAILTFIDQKSKLQEELRIIDSDRRSLENLLQAVDEKSPFDLTDSQLSLRTSTPFMYCSGRLSNRSKSMTSHSGDSFTGDIELPPSTPMRCHTALGICSSSSSLSQGSTSGGSAESLNDNAAVSAAQATSLSNASESGIVLNSMDENRNSLTCFETVHEGELLESNDKHSRGKHISGFLKKLTSSKRKKASKATGTGTL